MRGRDGHQCPPANHAGSRRTPVPSGRTMRNTAKGKRFDSIAMASPTGTGVRRSALAVAPQQGTLRLAAGDDSLGSPDPAAAILLQRAVCASGVTGEAGEGGVRLRGCGNTAKALFFGSIAHSSRKGPHPSPRSNARLAAGAAVFRVQLESRGGRGRAGNTTSRSRTRCREEAGRCLAQRAAARHRLHYAW
jgi:hypothetical protein